MAMTADAVVVGGGVVGASALFHLGAFGLRRVVLCERRQPGAAASGASGAFIQFHFCQHEAEARLTQASLPYFQHWDELVGAGTSGFVPAGYLRLEPAEREAHLRGRVALLRPLGVDTRIVDAADVTRLAPYLDTTGVAVAAYEPGSGYADAQSTIDGFLAAAHGFGGEIRTETAVTGLRTAAGRVIGVETTGGAIDAPVVILAAGIWTERLLAALDLPLPLSRALTQWLGFALPAGAPSLAMTVGDGVSQSYFRATRPGEATILLGLGGVGRRPLDDPDAAEAPIPADLAGLAQARLAARLKGSPAARFVGGRSGPVGLTPDDLPIVDRHPAVAGLFYFAGDAGSSFKTAPAIGRALAEWAVAGQPTVADLTAFRADRFGAA